MPGAEGEKLRAGGANGGLKRAVVENGLVEIDKCRLGGDDIVSDDRCQR